MYAGNIVVLSANLSSDWGSRVILFEEFDSINSNPNDIQTQRPDSIFRKVLDFLSIATPIESKPVKHQLTLNSKNKKPTIIDFTEIAATERGLLGKIPVNYSKKKQRVIILSLDQVKAFLASLELACVNAVLDDSHSTFALDILMNQLEAALINETLMVRAQIIDLLRRTKNANLPLKYKISLRKKNTLKHQKPSNENEPTTNVTLTEEQALHPAVSVLTEPAELSPAIESEDDVVFLMSNQKTEAMLTALEIATNTYQAKGRSHGLFKKHHERNIQIERLANYIAIAKQTINEGGFETVKNQILKVVSSALLRTQETHTPHDFAWFRTTSRLANYLSDCKDHFISNYTEQEVQDAEAFATHYTDYINTTNRMMIYFNKHNRTQASCFSFLFSKPYESLKSETQHACEISLSLSTEQFDTAWFNSETIKLKQKLQEENIAVYNRLFPQSKKIDEKTYLQFTR